ncbi:ASKHA domain-containing protein [Sulfuricystis thermophila]|uniref:ASKHA domain-containing protein n=1 Tax=Sulfuricystis thermophila TaxID=2496847 RepID=UPI001035542B|nr:ASKHA domain-containing protein [Sulfuricystis thermophila]
MPRLTLFVRSERHVIDYEPGQSLRDLLDATDFRVRSACHGLGACGLCRVRLLDGTVGAPTAAELLQIEATDRAAGVRLACQIHPTGDIAVALLDPAPPSEWRTPPPGLVAATLPVTNCDRSRPPGIVNPLGLAVDLGTSHLTLAFHELASGRRLGLRFGRNPQGHHGADVVTRLVAAGEPATARQLAGEVRMAIGTAIADAAQREGFDASRIGRVVIVGNTAMLALLANRNHQRLLQPSMWSAPLDCAPTDTAEWTSDWSIAPVAEVEVIPPLSGFVGSDLLAGLVASDLLAGPAPALFIDFGTNSEIALWTGTALWVTAAAGGPAFETGPGRCGMPAETGAVYRVVFDAAEQPIARILGNDEARGLCGSGLVDLVAGLRRQGVLTPVGRFADGRSAYEFVVGKHTLALDWRDVDALQRAKGAIGAGISVLCTQAGLALRTLRRVVAAGLFGRYLDVENARQIGLLPDVPAEHIELAGNSALTGAVALLLSESARAMLARARATASCVNLAKMANFDTAFLEHLYLRPMSSS